MFKDKITVVIQGPLHPNSLIAIRSISRDFNVVISHWKTNNKDEKNLDDLLERGDHTTVVSHSMESLSFKNNEANRFYQFYSTYKGMCLVDTEFVIKMRSDEYYTNLIPFAEAILENPDKYTSNDIFFRNPETNENENFLFHPSDHLYGGRTDLLKQTLKTCIDDCLDKTPEDLTIQMADLKNKQYPIVPEQHLFGNFILTKNPDLSLQSKKKDSTNELVKLMKENCKIVPCTELGFYSVSFSQNFCYYPSEKYYSERKDLRKI